MEIRKKGDMRHQEYLRGERFREWKQRTGKASDTTLLYLPIFSRYGPGKESSKALDSRVVSRVIYMIQHLRQ